MVDEVGLDVVQLHGLEPQSWARFIPVPVIKTFSVSSDGQVAGGEIRRPGNNQFVLLDAGDSSGSATGGGGEGKSFPWEYAKKIISSGEVGTQGEGRLPVILAGGLKPENVAQAIKEAGEVVAVDVSSGVEAEDGTKDAGKVQEFVRAAKGN